MQLDHAAGEGLIGWAREVLDGLAALAYHGVEEGNAEDGEGTAMRLLPRALVAFVDIHRLVDGSELVVPR
jgi:hypothetical protein